MTNYQAKIMGQLREIANSQYCIFDLFLDNLKDYLSSNNLIISQVDVENYCFITTNNQVISFNEII